MCLDQHVHSGHPQESARASTARMLSREKGRRYGESHQKAPQISVARLPLAHVYLLEGV